ncbi:MAG: FAD-dependent oxidoreductase [Candidatus Competibacter sp.]
MRQYRIAVVGAGIVGLTQALWLQRQGHRISVYERGGERLDHHCSHVGAGMLAPYCELSEAEVEIARWGASALALWQQIVPTLAQPVHMTCEGTLVVAHHRDRAGMRHLAERIERAGFGARLRWLRRDELRELEPELEGRFGEGLYLSPEGEIDPRSLLPALVETLRRNGATVEFMAEVEDLAPGEITVRGARHAFDWVLDCRGLAASDRMTDLRGVRGEILTLHTREVHLHRPIRMMHPALSAVYRAASRTSFRGRRDQHRKRLAAARDRPFRPGIAVGGLCLAPGFRGGGDRGDEGAVPADLARSFAPRHPARQSVAYQRIVPAWLLAQPAGRGDCRDVRSRPEPARGDGEAVGRRCRPKPMNALFQTTREYD